jgi:hypothetical protein
MAQKQVQVYKVSKTIDAPLKFVFDWCTDFSEEDPKITGSSNIRKILNKSKKKVVYAQLYKGDDGSQKVAVDIVTLKSPNSWHLDYFGEEDDEQGDYRLRKLPGNKTRLDMVFKENWKNVSKVPTIKEQVDHTNEIWDKYIEALGRDYRASL